MKIPYMPFLKMHGAPAPTLDAIVSRTADLPEEERLMAYFRAALWCYTKIEPFRMLSYYVTIDGYEPWEELYWNVQELIPDGWKVPMDKALEMLPALQDVIDDYHMSSLE